MAPPEFLAACVRRAVADRAVVAAALPVTDTVKELVATSDGPVVGTTHDRDELRELASPLVIPAEIVADLDGWPPADFQAALRDLRSIHPVQLLEGPPVARRVRSTDDLAVLEALTSP
jgi:2-C-methyl-D-erythritol 4-phosphate cytidylyltransferase